MRQRFIRYVLSLVTGITMFPMYSESAIETEQPMKSLFTGTAVEFLHQFGKYYGLFDYFFRNERISYPLRSKSGPVDEYYRLLDVNNLYRNCSGNSGQSELYDRQPIPTHSQHMYPTTEYEHRFKFGNRKNDRFMYIGVPTHQDLWNETLLDSTSYIHFIGFETNLRPKLDYFCEFTHPVKAVTRVQIIDDFLYPNGRLSLDQIVKCEVPNVVKRALIGEQLSVPSVTEPEAEPEAEADTTTAFSEVQLNLIAGTRYGDSFNITLLPDVKVQRLPMQGRRFSICQNLIIDELEEPLLKEYLLYYSMLGVEHFYIYDNSQRPPPASFKNSQLKEFLAANVVTLVHFPYTEDTHYNSMIQRVAANVHYQIYGHSCYWSGMIDINEFFVPAAQFIELLSSRDSQDSQDLQGSTATTAASSNTDTRNALYSDSLLLQVLNYSQELSDKPAEEYPGLMVSVNEMGCANPLKDPDASAKNNLHHGLTITPTPFIVNCIVRGQAFNAFTDGYGRYYIKPWREEMCTSPYRILDPHNMPMCGDYLCFTNGTVQAKVENIGIFYRFNSFKRSIAARGPYNPQGYTGYKNRIVLSKFVFKLFKFILGVEAVLPASIA